MPEVYKVSCECSKHDFVFSQKPWQDTAVKCPECGLLWIIRGDAPKDPVPGEPKVLEAKTARESPAAATPKKEGDK